MVYDGFAKITDDCSVYCFMSNAYNADEFRLIVILLLCLMKTFAIPGAVFEKIYRYYFVICLMSLAFYMMGQIRPGVV